MITKRFHWLLVLANLFPALVIAAPKNPPLIDAPSAKWRANCKAQPIVSRLKRQTTSVPKRLTVHFTDTPKNYTRSLNQKLCSLFEYAATKVEGPKSELWGDIPYHYYISANGQLGEARDTYYLVDSNTEYDRRGHIAIVVEGNRSDGINPSQKRKLFALLKHLQAKWKVPNSRIGTHKNFAQTDCPGSAILNAVADYKGETHPAHPNPRPKPVVRPNPAPRPSPRCETDRYCARKPRCYWGRVAVNKAPPGSCCPQWSCERSNAEEDWDDENFRTLAPKQKK